LVDEEGDNRRHGQRDDNAADQGQSHGRPLLLVRPVRRTFLATASGKAVMNL
jgi:hypothetical protein